ncbi:MAG: hypothetical protein ACI4FN_06390 [Acutalibacteraceae bacterium]
MKDYEKTFYIMQFVIIILTLALIFVTIKAVSPFVSLILLIVFAVIASSLNIALLVSRKK